MTVEELIKKLQEFDPALEVGVVEDGDFLPLESEDIQPQSTRVLERCVTKMTSGLELPSWRLSDEPKDVVSFLL